MPLHSFASIVGNRERRGKSPPLQIGKSYRKRDYPDWPGGDPIHESRKRESTKPRIGNENGFLPVSRFRTFVFS
jgi:hypothetical protein